MRIPTMKDLNFKGKVVFMRVDYNVSLVEDPPTGERRVRDDFRIVKTRPSIDYVLEQGGSLLLAAHLGRPKNRNDTQYSLEPVAKHLAEMLKRDILFSEDCIGDGVKKLVQDLRKDQGIVVLENLRFYPEEQKGDEKFAKQLAEHADCYVNDAFGVSHRADASVSAITKFFSQKAMGFLLEKEYKTLSGIVSGSIERPMAVILGGAKISDKIGVIKNLMDKADAFFIGGGMANTFLKARGVEIGKSLCEDEKVALAGRLAQDLERKKVALHLPIDVVATTSIDDERDVRTVTLGGIRGGGAGVKAEEMIADIGEDTVKAWGDALKKCKTILWNGPSGVFEKESFAKGTRGLCQLLAQIGQDTGCRIIAGGGETVAAIREADVESKFYHVSTGGGAMLEFLEGKALPGIEALKEYTRKDG